MTPKLLRELTRYLDITVERDIDEIDGAHWNKIVVSGTADEIQSLIGWFSDRDSSGFALSYSCPVLFEILDKNATKGKMLRNLKKFYGGVTTVAVGDYNNDLDMLRAADIAACPDNALDEIKAVSKYHLCHHRDGAIADLISKL
ncbi:hypothetical protein SDC9_121953 [bioreactor metagenome]|uniref:Uncharacterized protein n=1 Tax=bioreactor metagenome TaxID=1076179 RepID=A0A645CDF6_9ZZZZ